MDNLEAIKMDSNGIETANQLSRFLIRNMYLFTDRNCSIRDVIHGWLMEDYVPYEPEVYYEDSADMWKDFEVM